MLTAQQKDDLSERFKKEWEERDFDNVSGIPYSDEHLKYVQMGYELALENPRQLTLGVDEKEVTLDRVITEIAPTFLGSFLDFKDKYGVPDVWKNACDRDIIAKVCEHEPISYCFLSVGFLYCTEDLWDEVAKKRDFKEQMMNNIIPRIKQLIKNEDEHLKFLRDNNAPSLYISNSVLFSTHINQRLEEYKEYVNNI